MRVSRGQYINKIHTHCASCGNPKSHTTAPRCRKCYEVEGVGKPFGQRAVHKLRMQDLDEEQRTLYDAMMRGRVEDRESEADALGMIQLATERGELAKELEYWESPAETYHFTESTIGALVERGIY